MDRMVGAVVMEVKAIVVAADMEEVGKVLAKEVLPAVTMVEILEAAITEDAVVMDRMEVVKEDSVDMIENKGKVVEEECKGEEGMRPLFEVGLTKVWDLEGRLGSEIGITKLQKTSAVIMNFNGVFKERIQEENRVKLRTSFNNAEKYVRFLAAYFSWSVRVSDMKSSMVEIKFRIQVG